MRARVVVFVALAGLGCGAPPERDPSQWPISRIEVEREIPSDDPAEATYRAHCIACHGVDGRGAGAVTGADFTSPEGPLTRPDVELLESVLNGRTGTIGVMPAHRDMLGEERCAQVLAYVRAHFGEGIEVRAPEPALEPDAALDGGVDGGLDAGVDEGVAP